MPDIIAQGNNKLESQDLFFWRQYYDAFAMPMATNKPIPIDFRNERPLYGRVNAKNNIIYTINKEDYFRTLPAKSGGHIKIINFVADAFEDLQHEINLKVARGHMSRRGVFTDIGAEFGYLNVQTYYNDHLDTLYIRFLSQYLEAEWALAKRITSFETFMWVFLKFIHRDASRFPFTRTAFLSSTGMPPTISGLCIETHDVDFSKDLTKHLRFIKDSNFEAYRALARKFGFMLDRHAPWRLVADVTSPYMNKKMFKYGLSGANIFNKYFTSSYVFDIDVMRVVLYNWYNQYVTTYPKFKKMKTAQCKSAIFNNLATKHRVVAKYTPREKFISSEEYDNNFGPRYWLRQYLYIRLREVSAPVDDYEFNKIMRKVLTLYRVKNYHNALKYINAKVKSFQPSAIMQEDLGVYAGVSMPPKWKKKLLKKKKMGY